MLMDDFIIIIFVCIDDFLKSQGKLRKREPAPKLTDSEVLTMEFVGEFLGFGSDKAIYEYFKIHWSSWFPNLGARTTFAKQAANLCFIKEKFRRHLVARRRSNDLYLFDGFPIPICNRKRARRKNPFLEQASFGYCAAKDEKYFGFKGRLLTNQHGLILKFEMTSANADEQDALYDLAESGSTAIADKGLLGAPLKQRLKEDKNVNLQTPLRKNMKDERPKSFVNQIMNVRRKIETVIGQLVERFNIQSIRAKNLWRLLSKIRRKLCSHTIAFFLNSSITFDNLIKS
jgi:hypothetical protein